MGLLTGQARTFDVPNYVGTLFSLTPSSTPLLSAIGTLTGGGEAVDNKLFEWQGYDLRAAENADRLEGADAPTPRHRTRTSYQNVVQIYQSAIELSYTLQAATGRRSGLPGASGIDDEFDWQVEQELKSLKLDMELASMQGAFQNPGTNVAPGRHMAGIFSVKTGTNPGVGCIDSTHQFANAGTGRQLTKLILNDALQQVWVDGGISEEETATLIVSPTMKRKLTELYIAGTGYVEATRNIGGVALDTIITDFGRLNVMMSRYVPFVAGAPNRYSIGIFSLEMIKPRFLFIPNKGFLFAEPLAKTGSADRVQIYGEYGIELGSPLAHGRIDDLLASATF